MADDESRVERVAAAIGKAVYSHISWANLDNDARDDCRFSARAAIAVMEAGQTAQWGRAFWTTDCAGERTLFIDDQDGAFRDFEDAAQSTKLRYEESPYDLVVQRYVTPWLPVPDSEEKTDGDA